MKNAWNWIGKSILQFKFPLLGFILLLTIGLGFKASQIQLSYELAKILPASDERFQLYEGFKKKYGEDGAVMVIAVENPQIFNPDEFKAWRDLSNEVKKQAGIKNVLSLATLPELYIDSTEKKFKTRPLLDSTFTLNERNLSALKSKLEQLPIYKNFLFTEDLKTHLLLITLDQKVINDKGRITLVKKSKP